MKTTISNELPSSSFPKITLKSSATSLTSAIIQFTDCLILRNHQIVKADLVVQNGKILDPQKLFFNSKRKADIVISCNDAIIAPGFIDLQINGGFGVDFAHDTESTEECVRKVAKGILAHGVTAFCPTLVTSPPSVYHKVLPKLSFRAGDSEGATVLGAHIEGPFINIKKKGAHADEHITEFYEGFESVKKMYGSLENVRIVTLAPELENSGSVIEKFVLEKIVVSLGHSMADYEIGELAMKRGATLITHLFNAMQPFHHRDPGLVGLLKAGRPIFYGIISDGVHTHPSALRIAHCTHPEGLVLVTDAVSAMGLEEGEHHIGEKCIAIKGKEATIAGTNTLCGSIATMDECVRFFKEATGCSLEEALEAATLHPAQVLGIDKTKGTLNFGADADFIILHPKSLQIHSTWIDGRLVHSNPEVSL
nr:PREDICTED: N-acetylglucosamine-6-phosphate deacetylase [Bemisia tabaci]